MRDFYGRHRMLSWTLGSVAALLIILILIAALMDWNWARGPIARMITAKTGRPASIDGDLKVHLFSWEPSADIAGLNIGNPEWSKKQPMFGAEHIDVSVSLGRLLRGQIVLPKVEIIRPVVNLERDSQARASWEFTDNAGSPPSTGGKPTKLPSIRLLVIQDGKVDLVDRLKKLTLAGTLNAGEEAGTGENSAFQLRLNGLLNAKPLKVQFDGGPLLNLNPNTPYEFAVGIIASTIHVDAKVSITKPFDLGEFTAQLHLSGEDLADAYYLTGLALPNTAPYDISGRVQRDDGLIKIEGLQGRIGGSDISGSLRVETDKLRPVLAAKLVSKNLDIKDLAPSLGVQPAPPTAAADNAGNKVSANATKPKKGEKLLPDADLQLNRVRGMDADVTYHAQAVTAPKLPMKEVGFHIRLVNGNLKIDPLSFVLDQGAISGAVEIDARQDVPVTSIDMHVEHIDLSQFKSAKASSPPLTGELHGRLRVHGSGSSIHKLAATADGGMGIAIPHGEFSDVLAELTGINVLKGLGLLFTKDNTKTEIRCGVIDFEASQGLLTSKTFFVDTTNVLITGRGTVELSGETMNLSLQGDPKHPRLVRIHAPVTLSGSLADPTVGIKPGPLALQTGAAVALGVLLTPVASVLAFVDPGLAKDKDCMDVLNQEQEATSGTANSPLKKSPHRPVGAK